jgi:hydroxybutyrate-dimer hydrolase
MSCRTVVGTPLGRAVSRIAALCIAVAGSFGASGLAVGVAHAAEVELLGEPLREVYDGRSDDLLTAGLGGEGLRGAAPEFADPLQPRWRELRRRAIYFNTRALIDVREQGGYGVRYGARAGERIGGVEYLAALRGPAGRGSTTALLQIPQAFDPRQPCLVVVASSGSRGIFGALPTAGEWGLRRGCAVAHTDKGTGVGIHDVDRQLAITFAGRVVPAAQAAVGTAFVASEADVAGLPPQTLLFKHAHSRVNPEADWGRHVLQAGHFGLAMLNREYGVALRRPLTPRNTLIIAAGISNGGGAVLRALEVDRDGFFDGAVAAEPNVAVEAAVREFLLREPGEGVPAGTPRETGDTTGARRVVVRGLYDYASLHALLQPCAVLAEDAARIPLGAVLALNPALGPWCDSLARDGLVTGTTRAAQAADAQRQLLEAGVHADALRLGAINLQFGLWPSVTSTYAAAYAQAPANAHPCGLSFAAVDPLGQPRLLSDAELARAFSDFNGIAPGGGVAILRTAADGSRSVAAAAALDAQRCLRAQLPALAGGLAAIQMRGAAGRRPVIVLHGRDDSLVAVNHSSRAYVVAHARATRGRGELRYYELPGVQHFDAFVALPGLDGRYRPMQPALNAALDLLHARLTRRAPLPASQVVRDGIVAAPGADTIIWRDGILTVPR